MCCQGGTPPAEYAIQRVWFATALLCSFGTAAPYCEDGTCRLGTFDYAARVFYANRVGTPDAQTEGLVQTTADPYTKYLDESELRQTGAHFIGDAGTVLGSSIYFATFDFDGTLQKYSLLMSFEEELPLGQYGGHYFSAMSGLGSDHIVLGTGGSPGRILTVATEPVMEYKDSFTIPEDDGGIVGLATDGSAIIALGGSPPARVLLLRSYNEGNMTLESTLTLSRVDEISAPVSPHFLDTANQLAYVATRKGCFYRISYSSWSLQLDGWERVCKEEEISGLFGFAADSETQKAVVISVSPYRQLAKFNLDTGEVEQTVPLSKDMAYITNLFITSPTSGSSSQAIVVGQSRRSIPAIMQINLASSDLSSSWGIIAGGVCDEYSWTEDKRILWHDGGEIRRYPARFYGCIWVPLGRIATGAVIADDKLYLATERVRCTACTTEEPLFGTDSGFCVEEHEEYRAPSAKCGQEAHNTRALVWERALSYNQLQHLTNQLYGAVNTSLIRFQIGSIPKTGAMHASKVASGALTRQPTRWVLMSLVALLLAFLPVGEATTKSFHQSEEGCNCLRNCEIFDMGDCGDDSEVNGDVFEAAWNTLPSGDDNLCKALQAMAFCSVRQAELTVGHDEVVLCQGIAKQIGCNVDCGGAARLGHGIFSCSIIAVLAIIILIVA